MRAARSRCELARNTLSNALLQRSLEQMIEAWAMFLAHYRPQIARMGKNFARIAAVDWATYCKQAGAAKITCIFRLGPRRPTAICLYRLGQNPRSEDDLKYRSHDLI
jgi:hypothetical protein